MEKPRFKVSEFIAVTNQTLEYAFPVVEVEGEVASFKVNQNKFVFFDLKDEASSVGCFMMVFQLRVPIEDGMKVIVSAQPKLTKWGKFSLTVKTIRPSGEGSIKKSFELLKAKLEKEGLFDISRKRLLPLMPRKVAVISSTQSAGYSDFIKIVNDRWGGVNFVVGHVQVQGDVAANQVIRAIEYFNEGSDLADVLVIVRGGGSQDDLAAFNDEKLVRQIASSRIPTLIGVGHEIDVTLSDLAADKRAATPSNAAEILVPDKRAISQMACGQLNSMAQRFSWAIEQRQSGIITSLQSALSVISRQYDEQLASLQQKIEVLRQVDPEIALRRGYALIHGKPKVGEIVEIELRRDIIKAEVKDVRKKEDNF